MAKKTYKNTDNTSFHNVTFRASVEQLTKAFGDPSIVDNTGEDKVNFEWEMETSRGDVFCIYDWKYGRPLKSDVIVTWHIGAKSEAVSFDARNEIKKAL